MSAYIRRRMREEPEEPKACFFCSQNFQYIDFKDTETLKKFISGHAKIMPPKRTGSCRKHQRQLAKAVKRARFLALLPFTTR